jgi:23S rRNA pseudouridine2604 synthase
LQPSTFNFQRSPEGETQSESQPALGAPYNPTILLSYSLKRPTFAPVETRINKYLSEVGFCSRRAADILIEERRVTINGKVPEMGTKVKDGDDVRVDGKPIKPTGEQHVYIALNKPVGIVCTTNVRGEKNNIVDFVKHPKRIFPVGRLDKASEGLILLTSDGDIVNKILRARNHHEKEYIVSVNKPINDDFVKRMSSGIPILDTVTRPCVVEKIGRCTFRIILTQGLNRQIRRMCEYLGFEVTRLQRIRIMNIKLDTPTGKWRDLTKHELEELGRLTADSAGTID